MFRTLKLYFTDRSYYEQRKQQRKRYIMRQKAVRKKLKKLAKEFCPWSGWYMHEIVRTMLEFYYKTYEAGDCCWSETKRIKKIASQLELAMSYAADLDRLDNIENDELVSIAEKDKAFEKFVADWEKKNDMNATDRFLPCLAYSYLEKKWTSALYKAIGDHIWEWCD